MALSTTNFYFRRILRLCFYSMILSYSHGILLIRSRFNIDNIVPLSIYEYPSLKARKLSALLKSSSLNFMFFIS